MIEKIQAIKGMNDILPTEIGLWQSVEKILTEVLLKYAYQEIRFPLLEATQLFKRSIGDVTDIVEKEMYSFIDLNGESISLRPEGTASCIRTCLEHGLLYNQQQKLWYLGPMFRHEKPQKGRYRQFHQLGVEALGFPDFCIELELLNLTYQFWKQLKVEDLFELQINTLGTQEERLAYRQVIQDYFKGHFNELDKASQTRLMKNPLRILDSKHPQIQAIIKDAPNILNYLGKTSRDKFESLCSGLKLLNIPFKINPTLVRGLDYYEHTIFEWVNPHLGSQSTVCAGGRYDKLISDLGGDDNYAVGFALGLERIILSLQTIDKSFPIESKNSVYIISSDAMKGLLLAEMIRTTNHNWTVYFNDRCGSFKSQFKKAGKSGADLALILGEDEIKCQTVTVKKLKYQEEQQTLFQKDLIGFLEQFFIEI